MPFFRTLCTWLMLSAALAGNAHGKDPIPADANATVTTVLARTTTSWDGQPLPAYPQGTPEISILQITIPPKTRLPEHMHPVINAGVLLNGELTVVTERNDTLHLQAGQALVEVVGTWHYGFNPGETPAEILVFYAGVVEKEITIRK